MKHDDEIQKIQSQIEAKNRKIRQLRDRIAILKRRNIIRIGVAKERNIDLKNVSPLEIYNVLGYEEGDRFFWDVYEKFHDAEELIGDLKFGIRDLQYDVEALEYQMNLKKRQSEMRSEICGAMHDFLNAWRDAMARG